jgi:hypothetical protein
MPVVLEMSTGEKHMLDRNLMTHDVAKKINDARQVGKLIEFQNNATPSRAIWIDPEQVIAIRHDGHHY